MGYPRLTEELRGTANDQTSAQWRVRASRRSMTAFKLFGDNAPLAQEVERRRVPLRWVQCCAGGHPANASAKVIGVVLLKRRHDASPLENRNKTVC